MKTISNFESKPTKIVEPSQIILHTSSSKISQTPGKSDTITETEAVPYFKIKKPDKIIGICSDGPIRDLDCTLDFTFEKNRIKAIENTELFASISTTAVGPDTQTFVLKQAEKSILEVSGHYEKIDSICYWLRNVAIGITLVTAVGIIGTFFAILFLSLNSVPIQDFVIWLSLESISCLAFMYISVKITGLNRMTINNIPYIFKFIIIYILAIIAVMIVANKINPISDAIQNNIPNENAENKEIKRQKIINIIMIIFFFSCLLKLLVAVGYITAWTIMLFIEKHINELQSNTKIILDSNNVSTRRKIEL